MSDFDRTAPMQLHEQVAKAKTLLNGAADSDGQVCTPRVSIHCACSRVPTNTQEETKISEQQRIVATSGKQFTKLYQNIIKVTRDSC